MEESVIAGFDGSADADGGLGGVVEASEVGREVKEDSSEGISLGPAYVRAC